MNNSVHSSNLENLKNDPIPHHWNVSTTGELRKVSGILEWIIRWFFNLFGHIDERVRNAFNQAVIAAKHENLVIHDKKAFTVAKIEISLQDLKIKEIFKEKIPEENKNNGISVTNEEFERQKKRAPTYLNGLWDKYKKEHPQSDIPSQLESVFGFLEQDRVKGAESAISPDQRLGNLLLQFENDPEVLFAPIEEIRFKQNEKKYDKFRLMEKIISSAFLLGKKMVVIRLGNDVHGVAIGFHKDGSFKIIDSMSSCIIDIQEISTYLNQAQIFDNDGHKITFKGEYINTNIQLGGNECLRFATLYCCQMAKKRSLDAFEEVNGAFLNGALKSFEDIEKIDGSVKVKDLKGKQCEYKDFMRSWAYRTYNLKADHWKDLTLEQLCPQKEKGIKKLFFCPHDLCLIPQLYKLNENIELIFDDGNGSKTPINNFDELLKLNVKNSQLFENFLSDSLGKYIAKNKNELNVAFLDKDNHKLWLLTLTPGQKFLEKRESKERLLVRHVN